MEKTDKNALIKEMNELSTNFPKNKERMMEIAKILLAEHYGFHRKENRKNDWSFNW